jgi:oligogalacturonide transport system substrate-binding protein
MKKALSLLVALCIVAFLFAACSSNEPLNNTAGNTQDSSASASASSEKQEINLRMFWWGGDARHKATLEMIDYYCTKIAPNVKIEAEYQGWDGYYAKLYSGLAAGTAPDIIQNNVRFIKSLYAAGDFFCDLNDFPELDMEAFDKEFLANQGTQPDGKLIGAPTGMNAWVMLVNKDFFNKYGIDYNRKWTWEDLFEVSEKVRAQNPEAYLLWNITFDAQFNIFTTYVSQITGDNWAYDDYTPGFTEDAIYQGLDLMKRMVEQGVFAPPSMTAMSVGPEDDGFRKGISGLTTYSASAMAVYSDMNIDVVNLPVSENAKQTAIGIESSQIMSIPKSSKYPNEAAKFIQFMLNEEEGVRIGGTQRGIPASKYAREILSKENMLDPIEVKAMEQAVAAAGNPYSGLDLDERFSKLRQDIMEKVMLGEMSVKDGASALYNQSLDLLKEMKESAE